MLEHQKARPWVIASNEVQLATWREALVASHGNIKRAAEAIGIARSHATTLTRKFGLVEFAAQLRLAHGAARTVDGERKGVVTGRPRKS